ncbi:MAG TPA: hypothetical protein VIN08_07165 [Ohtaekwangia sp.]|uniref:hypothetical protein n=1 Tax=Ohtaekwangia sp. TaxID=2066019 RepID=UPI002F923C09
MRGIFIAAILLIVVANGFAQETLKPTISFTISGKVKSPKTFSWEEIRKFKVYNLGDIEITNHKGEVKGTAKDLSGILLRDLLQSIELDAESPKVLSEYYFTCQAADGYKVVYSWNELFNTAVGNSVYIVTVKENQAADKLNESILMISTQDIRTGRRYVKNLQSIIVRRTE